MKHFQSVKCPDSSLFVLLCRYFNTFHMKSYHILKLKVFHVKSNNISPCVEFSVYTFFKLNNVRILYFLVSFATNPNSTCKIHFFPKPLHALSKKAVILFLLWSALFRKFSRSRILLLEVAL